MSTKHPINWMLSNAVEALARAERLHHQFLHLQPSTETREPSWEPPIDVLETEREVLILIALPGVDPNAAAGDYHVSGYPNDVPDHCCGAIADKIGRTLDGRGIVVGRRHYRRDLDAVFSDDRALDRAA